MAFISTSCLKGSSHMYEKNLFKVLDTFKKIGVKNIELGAVHKYMKNLNPLFRYKKENDVNFIIHGYFPPAKDPFMLNIASQNKTMLKRSIEFAFESIELCRRLDSDLYGIHGGFLSEYSVENIPITEPKDYELCFKTAKESLIRIFEHAKNNGIRIAVENMPGYAKSVMFIKLEEFERLFKEIKDRNFGMLLDIGHLKASEVFGAEKDKKKFLERIKHKVFEMHIHDLVGKQDHFTINNNTLKWIPKDVLKKAYLTLEAHKLNEAEILRCKGIMEKAES